MFDQLFKDSRARTRHRDGPLAEERRRYLVHCGEQQMGLKTLLEIARFTLAAANSLRLAERPSELFTREEIKAVADRWKSRRSIQLSLPALSSTSRLFTRHATRWLSFLGRLQPTITTQPYAEQLTKFANYMRQERGLSPRTIEFNCRVAREFLARLGDAALQLDTLTIVQVDEILAQQVREGGYGRITVRGYFSRLRAFFRYAESREWCRTGIAGAIVAPRVFRDEAIPAGPSWEDVKRMLVATEGNQRADIRAR
jgi:integrase/recombinase XerD